MQMHDMSLSLPEHLTIPFSRCGLDLTDFCKRAIEKGAKELGSLAIASVCIDSPALNPLARKVLNLAEAEAADSRSLQVEPTHILLGLLLEGAGVAARVLRQRGVAATAIRNRMSIGQGSDLLSTGFFSADGSRHYSEEAVKVLHYSAGEALLFGKAYLGTEHLLLGMLSSSIGPCFPEHFGVDPTALREDIKETLVADKLGGLAPFSGPVSLEQVTAVLLYLRKALNMEVRVSSGEEIIRWLIAHDVSLEVRGRDLQSGHPKTQVVDSNTVRSVLDSVGYSQSQ